MASLLHHAHEAGRGVSGVVHLGHVLGRLSRPQPGPFGPALGLGQEHGHLKVA